MPGSSFGSARTTKPVPAKLFLSYKHSIPADEKLAHAILGELKAAGHDVFIDFGMKVGTDWVAEIARRISWCDFLVVLLSESAAKSEMVQAEVRLAHHQRRYNRRPVILPVRVNYDGPLDYELDAYLGRIQYILWSGDQDNERVTSELKKSIKELDATSPDSTLSLDELDVTAPSRLASDRRRPKTSADPRVLLPPGGTIRLEDHFYIPRQFDGQIEKTANFKGQTLVIKAARQMGKSSLLIRYLARCKHFNKQFAFIDFQSFSESDLSGFPELTRRIAHVLIRAFKLAPDPHLDFDTQMDFTYYVEDRVLKTLGGPLTIAMDEVDRILGRSYQSEFFSMLRHWHNERAQPSSPWEDVDLAMVIATEPYLLIPEGDRSPFNVTPAIELEPFQREHLCQINESYGEPLTDPEMDQLYELLSGHPYLTRLAFYRLVSSTDLTFATLIARSCDPDGPFGEHLRSRLLLLQKQGEMLSAMKKVISKRGKLDFETSYRLRAAGLVARHGKDTVPSNLLYARFFKDLQ